MWLFLFLGWLVMAVGLMAFEIYGDPSRRYEMLRRCFLWALFLILVWAWASTPIQTTVYSSCLRHQNGVSACK